MTTSSRMLVAKVKMAADEHSLLQCLDLKLLPVQIDNSQEQNFLLHEKEIICPVFLDKIILSQIMVVMSCTSCNQR